MLFQADRNTKEQIFQELRNEAEYYHNMKLKEKNDKIKQEKEWLDNYNRRLDEDNRRRREEQMRHKSEILGEYNKMVQKKIDEKLKNKMDMRSLPQNYNNAGNERVFQNTYQGYGGERLEPIKPLGGGNLSPRASPVRSDPITGLNQYYERPKNEFEEYLKQQKLEQQKYYRNALDSQFSERKNNNFNYVNNNNSNSNNNSNNNNISKIRDESFYNPYSGKKYDFGRSELIHNPIINPNPNLNYNPYINFDRSNQNNAYNNKKDTLRFAGNNIFNN